MANEFVEFAKSYTGGWGKIPLQKSGGIRTFQMLQAELENPRTDDSIVTIEIITARGLTKILKYAYGYVKSNAEWYYPESKYVNTLNYVVRSVAYPNRQYMKVLTQQNCYFADATSFKLPDEAANLRRIGVLDVLDNYNSAYPSYAACFAQLENGEALARAFARRFLLSLHPEIPYPILVYRNSPIGYDRGDVIICEPGAEKLGDTIVNLTGRGVQFKKESPYASR